MGILSKGSLLLISCLTPNPWNWQRGQEYRPPSFQMKIQYPETRPGQFVARFAEGAMLIIDNPEEFLWSPRTLANSYGYKQQANKDSSDALALATRMFEQTEYLNMAKRALANIGYMAWFLVIQELPIDRSWAFLLKPGFHTANMIILWIVGAICCNPGKQSRSSLILKDIQAFIITTIIPEMIIALIGIYLPGVYYSFMMLPIYILVPMFFNTLQKRLESGRIQWEAIYMQYTRIVYIPSIFKSSFMLIRLSDFVSWVIWNIYDYFIDDSMGDPFSLEEWLIELLAALPEWVIIVYLVALVSVYAGTLYQQFKQYNDFVAKGVPLPFPDSTILRL